MIERFIKKVILFKFGSSLEGLDVKDVKLVGPGPGQVAVRLLAAPINPSDLGVIGGTYARLPDLPAVPGREGVGTICAVGEGVDIGLLRKRVRMPQSSGSWQDCAVTEVQSLVFIPEGIPMRMAAMSFINPPTAWCLLHDFVLLGPGDWIIQNAGNSAVGMCIIQMAHHFGFRTINIVRDLSWEGPLKAMGADVVLEEGSGWEKDPSYHSFAKLALNSVGGASGVNLIKALVDGGVHVTFGGMVRDAVVWPTRDLIFKKIALRGFALDRIRNHSESYESILSSTFDLIRRGIINIPIEKSYGIEDTKKAIARAAGYHRKGKILLTPSLDWMLG